MKRKRLHQLINAGKLPVIRAGGKRKKSRKGKLDIPWAVIVRGRR